MDFRTWTCQCWPASKNLYQLCANTAFNLEDLQGSDGWRGRVRKLSAAKATWWFLRHFSPENFHVFHHSHLQKNLFFFQGYICWDSFDLKSKKINHIKTLTHHTIMIHSKGKMNDELESNIFLANGYPESVIQSNIKFTISNFIIVKTFSSQKCPIYIKIPWIESSSQFFLPIRFFSVIHHFNSTVVLIDTIFTTKSSFLSIHKDILPTLQQSLVIYHFVGWTI